MQFQSVRIKNVMCNCYLLHLSRFFVLTKSASTLRQEKIMTMLRAAPEHFVEYDTVREALGMHYTAFKKLMSAMHNKGQINSHAVSK